MSRSKRKPAFFICNGADPKKGKQTTSREIRRTVRQKLHTEEEDFDFVHPLDNTRGHGGSRDEDYGWDYFGDGKVDPYHLENWTGDPEVLEKLKRK